jgi:hypothetical protein
LGAIWDSDALVKRATFGEPTLPSDGLKEQYGAMLANDSCSDAEILEWQQLRRDLGEDSGICRIVWHTDDIAAVTYDVGCAIPLVVIPDAVR